MDDRLLDLPFDQFARHRIVGMTADRIRQTHAIGSLAILDVGGYPCLTPQFTPGDSVVVIDIVQSAPPDTARFVRADGSRLPFRDAAFDLVVSLDSLEHVPVDRRGAYVEELLRASRSYVLLVAPASSEITELAERLLAEFVRVVNQEDQPQLQEHRQHGLPDFDEWEAVVRARGLHAVRFSSGYVYNWLAMMLLKHYVSSLPGSDELHRTIDRFYNVSLRQVDARLPGYRQGLLISKLGPTAVLGEMSAALAPSGEADRLEVIERLEQLSLLLKLADLHVASRKDDRLREEVIAKDRHILNLEMALREAQQGLEDTQAAGEQRLEAERARAAALEQRLQSLEAHVEEIQQGRVMRVLSAVDRLRGGPT
jgi:hypothetical protein